MKATRPLPTGWCQWAPAEMPGPKSLPKSTVRPKMRCSYRASYRVGPLQVCSQHYPLVMQAAESYVFDVVHLHRPDNGLLRLLDEAAVRTIASLRRANVLLRKQMVTLEDPERTELEALRSEVSRLRDELHSHEVYDEYRRSSANRTRKRPWWTYYVQRGEYIKIGRSRSLASRMHALSGGVNSPGDAVRLLAVELGDFEKARHDQFADLRVEGEWFRPDDRLWAHVNQLGQQSVNAWLETVRGKTA